MESDETLSDDEIETTGGTAIASETADADDTDADADDSDSDADADDPS
jgi:hypothetical protein